MLHQDPLPFSWWKGLWSVTDIADITNLWWMDTSVTGGGFWRHVLEDYLPVFSIRISEIIDYTRLYDRSDGIMSAKCMTS